MNLTDTDKTEYIETNSHCVLAKRLGVSMITLDTYAEEQGVSTGTTNQLRY